MSTQHPHNNRPHRLPDGSLQRLVQILALLLHFTGAVLSATGQEPFGAITQAVAQAVGAGEAVSSSRRQDGRPRR